MRWLIALLAPLPFLLLAAVALLFLPLPAGFPAVGSSGRNLMAAVGTGLLGMVYVVGVAVVTVRGVMSRARRLDGVLASTWLRPTSPGITGRSYAGVVGGRDVHVDFVQSHWFAPALVNLRVAAEAPGKMALSARGPLLACTGCPRLEDTVPGLPEIGVYAHDEAAVARWLGQDRVVALLQALLADQRELGLRQLYFIDEGLWLRAHPRRGVAPEQVAGWLDALVALAEAREPKGVWGTGDFRMG